MSIEPYLKLMAQKNASDLFFTVGAPASVKIEGEMRPISRHTMAPGSARPSSTTCNPAPGSEAV